MGSPVSLCREARDKSRASSACVRYAKHHFLLLVVVSPVPTHSLCGCIPENRSIGSQTRHEAKDRLLLGLLQLLLMLKLFSLLLCCFFRRLESARSGISADGNDFHA